MSTIRQYEVLRPIEAFGEQLQPGTVVDVSTWRPRNVQALVANKRLRELTLAPAPEGMAWQLVPNDEFDIETETDKKPGKTGKEK